MAKQKITQNQIGNTVMVAAQRPNGATSAVAGPAVLIFTQADMNVGSGYSTGTGVFTAPRAGKYFVNFGGFKDSNAGSGAMWIRKNGSNLVRQYISVGSVYGPMNLTYIVQCAVNDTIDIYISTGLTMHGNESSQLVIMYVGE